ncbi:MAG TPA: SH3 domain-containing protein [Clostridia bacterium]|nr:SH3 domain-containing protein [Clostridia bacterium]
MKMLRVLMIFFLVLVLAAGSAVTAGQEDITAFSALTAEQEDITAYKQFESNVPGVSESMLYPEFWIKNTPDAGKLIAAAEEIAEFNRVNVRDAAAPLADLENYQQSFTKAELAELIRGLSKPATSERYNSDGELVGKKYYDLIISNLNLNGLRDVNAVRYGIAVRRTEMRTFPTYDRLYSSPANYNIDRFMETVAYPAEPLVILSTSKDGQWYFAQMYNYLAWIPAKDVAVGDKTELFSYVNREPFLTVTAPRIHASFNPMNAELSELRFDMGARLPLATASEVKAAFYDQNPAGNFVVKVPTRNEEGKLIFDYVLISRSADVSLGYLPYTKENIIKQAFKLQGERYGWGGMFNGRDCSAFLMDIFRTMGVRIPRNASEQGKLMVGRYYDMPASMTLGERKRLFDGLEPGTALYMSGHAMLYLGKYEDEYYMIHDFSGFSVKNGNGELVNYSSWEVAVTPLSILRSSGGIYMEALYGARVFLLE